MSTLIYSKEEAFISQGAMEIRAEEHSAWCKWNMDVDFHAIAWMNKYLCYSLKNMNSSREKPTLRHDIFLQVWNKNLKQYFWLENITECQQYAYKV